MRFDWLSVPDAPRLNTAMKRLETLLKGFTRTSDGDLKHGGKLIATDGLGVGNSAAATTPGSVTHRIEVFDGAGASLGYLAVYDSIT